MAPNARFPTSEYQLNKTKMDTQWLKSAQENFKEAVSQRDWDTAKALIADTMDKGFHDDAHGMNLMLREAMDEEPQAIHGYVLGFLRKKNEEYKAKGLVPTLDMLIDDLTK